MLKIVVSRRDWNPTADIDLSSEYKLFITEVGLNIDSFEHLKCICTDFIDDKYVLVKLLFIRCFNSMGLLWRYAFYLIDFLIVILIAIRVCSRFYVF